MKFESQITNADGLLGVRLLADVGFTKRLLQAHNRALAAAALLARAEAPASPLQQHPLVSGSDSARGNNIETQVKDDFVQWQLHDGDVTAIPNLAAVTIVAVRVPRGGIFVQSAARSAAPRRPAAVQLFACRQTVIRPCSLRSQAGRTMAVNSGLKTLLAGTMLPMPLQGSNHAAVC